MNPTSKSTAKRIRVAVATLSFSRELLGSDGSNATSAVEHGLLPSHTYYFATVAYTATGAQSSHSNELAHTVPTP